jgi:hypothetical protein
MHATLVTDTNGVWVFRWHPPRGVHRLRVPGGTEPLPGWTAPGAAGRAVLTGPVSRWHVTSTGRPGYVADRLEWNRWPGRYDASVRLSARGPVNVEVWNNTGNVLLARDSLPRTDGIQSITLPVAATTGYPAPLYGGWVPSWPSSAAAPRRSGSRSGSGPRAGPGSAFTGPGSRRPRRRRLDDPGPRYSGRLSR